MVNAFKLININHIYNEVFLIMARLFYTPQLANWWIHSFVPHLFPSASRPSCVSHFTDVCRTSGTIGKDWIYLDSSMTNEDTLANSTRELLNAIAQQEYSQACTAILVEYICVSKFPSCDLSHTTPRSIPVRLALL